ncbi:oxidoreductase [Obba rivulosa]|uniref:Oxidoreductase n=1 Tax=Obba rivulosa TaxID=1052685 RepID=A0A8E2ASI4_9APHY|nr:oxidoreductase [Obba rivulosa]
MSLARVALITGCSKGGIGFSLCEEFAAQGCKVYATARRVESMEGFTHPNIERLRLDVNSEQNVKEVIDSIVAKEGKIDIVVNNAGVASSGPIIDIPMDSITNAFDTNVLSIVRVSKAVIPHMASERSGVIVNMGSIAGDTPTPFGGIYSATKAGVKLLSETLYMECAPFNIHVVHITAGSIRSNIVNNAQFKLPDDSIYAPWLEGVYKRLNASQGPDAITSEDFAKKVVPAVMSNHPPRVMSLGGNATLFAVFNWLPRGWLLRFLWGKIAGKPKTD